MSDLCHHLNTLIVMWGGGTEWYVYFKDGMFHAEPSDSGPRPEPEPTVEKAIKHWEEWFRCQRG